MKTALLTIGAVIVGGAILVGIWFGGWALTKANTAKRYDVNTGTQQYQAGLISQERDRVAGYDTAIDPAQKAQIAATFCTVFAEIKPAPEDLVLAQSRICY